MNSRDRILVVIIIVTIVGSGILFGAGIKWFWNPLKESLAKIEALREDNEILEEKIFTFQREVKKLELARRKSLPANPEMASSEYINYLQPMLRESGLNVEDVTHTTAVEYKAATTVAGIKKINHQVITFQVRAKGELDHLVKALQMLHHRPYEHRIKNLTIDRADTSNSKDSSSKLVINMIIETLLVARTESRPGIPPGIDPQYLILDGIAARHGITPLGWGLVASTVMLKQAMPTPKDRQYAEIAQKNIFVGAIPMKKVIAETAKDTGPEAPPEFTPQYVRLVTTVPNQNTAYLRNLVYKTREEKLIARPNSGYEFFKITDENRDYVFFHAKVLRVDARDMYFQVKNQVYAIHIGQSLEEGMKNSLSIDQLEDLKLDLVYDVDWAREQTAKDQEKISDRKKRGKER